MAEWSLNFSPIAGLDDEEFPEALLLDISGCDHLFGSEKGLALRMQGNLKHWGYAPQMAVADSIGQNDEIARCIQQLVRAKKCAGKLIATWKYSTAQTLQPPPR